MSASDSASRPESASSGDTLRRLHSARDVDATAAALQTVLKARGIRVFAVIDHAAAAREAGLAMRPTQVIVFGNPKGGTPLMQAHPDLALDLPVRVLVRETEAGRVEVVWRDSAAMAHLHGMPAAALEGLKPLDALIADTLGGAAR